MKMDYLDKLENKISQGARFQMAIDQSYFWCVKTEIILNDTNNDHYHFGLAGQLENWYKSKHILN